MTYLSSHQRQFLFTESYSISDIEKGDLVSFFYKGNEKFVLVLNPDHENKLHGLSIEKIPRNQLVPLFNRTFKYEPMVLYNNWLRNQVYVEKGHSYRIYLRREISSVRFIMYNYDIPTADPETMIKSGKATIITTDGRGRVLASDYKHILMSIKHEIEKFGLFIPHTGLKGVNDFFKNDIVKTVLSPKKVSLWTVRKSGEEEMEEYLDRLQLSLEERIKEGGVIIISSRELNRLRSRGLKL